MKHSLIKFFSFLLAGLLIIVGGFYFYLNFEDGKKQKEVQVDELDDAVKKERVNVLLLGINNQNNGGARTDSMMLLSMEPENKTAFMLSIPRDSRVKLKNRENPTKLNHAHAYGGVELTLSAVKDILQIPIHHYIRIDYEAVAKTVDDVGGVEVDVPMDMDYEDPYADPPLSIHLKKGVQVLEGKKAMEFLRFRRGYATQDLGRMKAQQHFMESLIKKVMSPASITKIPQYAETIYKYVDTDMSQKEMFSLIKDAIKINPDKIEKLTLKGEAKTVNGASFYILDQVAVKEQLEYLLSGNYETEGSVKGKGEDIEQTLDTSSGDIRIAAYNGSGYRNIARKVSDILKMEDIIVTHTANASTFDNPETHIYYKNDKELAKKIKKILGAGVIFEGTATVDYNESDIVIILGKDFKNHK